MYVAASWYHRSAGTALFLCCSTCFEQYFHTSSGASKLYYSLWYYTRMSLPAGIIGVLELHYSLAALNVSSNIFTHHQEHLKYITDSGITHYVAAVWYHGSVGTALFLGCSKCFEQYFHSSSGASKVYYRFWYYTRMSLLYCIMGVLELLQQFQHFHDTSDIRV